MYTSLLHVLAGTVREKFLWISETAAVSAAAIAELVSGNERTLIAGKRVALFSRDPQVAAVLMILCDGAASEMLLLPSDLDAEGIHALCIMAGSEIVFADTEIALEGIQSFTLSIPVVVGRRPLSLSAVVSGLRTIETRWIIPTSGTTERPKLVVHTLASLTTATIVSSKYEGMIWGLLYDVVRFAGLQVFFQSFMNGGLLLMPDRTTNIAGQVAFLAKHTCSALSATPTQWRKILMTGESQLLALQQITLGGERADQNILNALSSQYPEANITHIYASTEAGVGFAIHDKREGFPVSYVQQPPRGVEISVDADGFLMLRKEIHAEQYLGESRTIHDASGWINTGDIVKEVNGRFLFLGRANGAINVGGSKVFPEEVESVILEMEEIALVRVGSKKSSIVGEVVEAFVVTKDNETDFPQLRKKIAAHCASRLPGYKVPAIITNTTDIDTTTAGKLTRR